jgi:hypothetical protein
MPLSKTRGAVEEEQCHMDAKSHIHITQKAIEWQAAEAKRFWSKAGSVLQDASVFPDIFGSPNHTGKECSEPKWRDYMFIPVDGGEKFLTSLYKTEMSENIRKTLPHVLMHYLSGTLDSLENNDSARAAKFAGCLSHIVGDTGQPAHVVSDELMAELMPYPSGKCVIYHFAVESVLGRASGDYTPRLLGKSVDEINWRITEEFEILRKTAMSQEIPILGALYAGDIKSAEVAADVAVQACAELFADILKTIYCISCDSFDNADTEALDSFELSRLVPAAKFCDMIFGYRPMIDKHPLCVNKRFVPMIPFDLGLGKEVRGISLLANMAPAYGGCRETFVEYAIPQCAYGYFESVFGLNHLCENETGAVFEIWLDDEMKYESPVMTGKADGVDVKINLGDARRIKLRVTDASAPPCPTAFFYPVWGMPRLTSRKEVLAASGHGFGKVKIRANNLI